MPISHFQTCKPVDGSEGSGAIAWGPETSYEALRTHQSIHSTNMYRVPFTSQRCVNPRCAMLSQIDPVLMDLTEEEKTKSNDHTNEKQHVVWSSIKGESKGEFHQNISSMRVLHTLFSDGSLSPRKWAGTDHVLDKYFLNEWVHEWMKSMRLLLEGLV